MLSPYIKRNISRIIPFAVLWLFFSLVYSLMERGILGNNTVYPATGNPYNFNRSIWVTAGTALVTGLCIGTIEVLYLNKLFQRKSFAKKIFFKTLLYLGIIILFLLINTLIFNASELHSTFTDPAVWRNVRLFFFNYAFWGVCIYIAATISVSLFYAEVSENLGEAVLRNFLTGKYHTPTQEDRIFMFLDMKASTTIAEQLGHVRYFEMLKQYFADMATPIIRHAGEIYQYVGDEIVVSWPMRKGLSNNNCLQCFFAIRSAIAKQRLKYEREFGVLPEFKAGFHCGRVTTGEIGVLKKEIIFTGDVLNTTARIQGLCNQYKTDILVSGELISLLDPVAQFSLTALGESELRGRDEKIDLFTISPVNSR